MKFCDVAKAFDVIEKESSRIAITKLLADLFRASTPNQAAIIAYMSLGQLNPVYVGTHFNIAEKSLIKGNLMLENIQIINDNGEAKFAVIHFQEYLNIKDLLSDESKLQDYLDYLHIQNVKKQTQKMFNLDEVKQQLSAAIPANF